MARIKRGILGGFSGSVANVVGTSWKGIGVMKSKPLSVANPRSAGQVSQRTKFTGIVAVAKALLSSICIPVWNGFASQMSGYNMFVSSNVSTAFEGNGDFSPVGLSISPGSSLASPDFGATCTEGDLSVEFSWVGTVSGSAQQDTDKAFGCVLNAQGVVIGSFEPSTARSMTSKIVTLSEDIPAGNILNAYLSFVSADGKRAFVSQWFQLTVTA